MDFRREDGSRLGLDVLCRLDDADDVATGIGAVYNQDVTAERILLQGRQHFVVRIEEDGVPSACARSC